MEYMAGSERQSILGGAHSRALRFARFSLDDLEKSVNNVSSNKVTATANTLRDWFREHPSPNKACACLLALMSIVPPPHNTDLLAGIFPDLGQIPERDESQTLFFPGFITASIGAGIAKAERMLAIDDIFLQLLARALSNHSQGFRSTYFGEGVFSTWRRGGVYLFGQFQAMLSLQAKSSAKGIGLKTLDLVFEDEQAIFHIIWEQLCSSIDHGPSIPEGAKITIGVHGANSKHAGRTVGDINRRLDRYSRELFWRERPAIGIPELDLFSGKRYEIMPDLSPR